MSFGIEEIRYLMALQQDSNICMVQLVGQSVVSPTMQIFLDIDIHLTCSPEHSLWMLSH